MNEKVKKYAKEHKVLTLQITKECFIDIMKGEQKIEHRYIYPNNASRYIIQEENEDGSVDVEVIKYDALYLINGRRKDAPRMLVEVKGAEFVICVDENGNDIVYKQDGVEYVECQMWYHLGRVLDLENCEKFSINQ